MTEEQTGLLSRITRWFRKSKPANGPIYMEVPPQPEGEEPADESAIERAEPRGSFLRPWAKQTALLERMQEGFITLTDLMASIREQMQKQSERQDQLIGTLQTLPQVMQSIPEGQKVQTETLRMIMNQMEQQNAQQAKLNEVFDKVADTHADQKQILESLGDRVENLSAHDEAISDNLRTVGVAMQDASRHSQSSTQVLQQMREQFTTQSSELQTVLQRQNTRFTTMLAIAIFLAVAALVAVAVVGYLLLTRGH